MSLRSLARFTLLSLILAAAGVGATVQAGSISLAWDPVVHDDLAGYRVYYGTNAANLDLSLDVGLSTQAVLNGLNACTTYHVAVKAYDSLDEESPAFSNVVTGWPRPEVDSASPSQVTLGNSDQVVISGSSFQPGATVQFSNPGVSVDGVTVLDCTQVAVDISVSGSAGIGAVDVTVINPDQTFGTRAGLISVVDDTAGPAISAVNDSAVGSTTASISWSTDEPADSQVFYREVGESSYQQTAIDPALVTAHDVALTGLAPSTAYEYYVRSVDGSGNASTANGSGFTTSANGYTYLRIEAESTSVTAPLQSGSGTEAFDNGWVQLAGGTATGSPGNPSGSWDVGFHVPSAGNWQVWFRVYGASSSSDGWLEAVDGAALDYVEPSANGSWEWVEARSYSLGAGLHTLTLGGHEAGARLDRVLITDDPTFQPAEQPGADVNSTSPASSVDAVGSDTAVSLGWSNPNQGDLARVVVRYRTDGRAPQNPHDGWPLLDRAATPGAAESLAHTGLTNGLTYHYAIFAIDGADNVAAPATAQAMPEQPAEPLGEVQNLHRTDVIGN